MLLLNVFLYCYKNSEKKKKKNVLKKKESGNLQLCLGYVNNSLLLAKADDINNISDKFNSFNKNVKSTLHGFEDEVHFLNITTDKIMICVTNQWTLEL